jgi:Carboxypeptidase regulatory-like domain
MRDVSGMGLIRRRVRSTAKWIPLLLWFTCAVLSCFAQEASTGKIQGTVTGKEGEKITAAKVIITNRASKQAIATTTKPDGTFLSAELPPGDYAVRVDAKGVESPVVPATVQAGATATADVRVLPSVVEINTEEATVEGALRAEQIENLPVNGRNSLDLGQLEPGIQNQDANALAPSKSGILSISVDSFSARESRIHMDGTEFSDEVSGGPVSSIPESAIQEFRVTQSFPGLATEIASSGVVNITTKSGTNNLHGEAFGFYRNGDFASASLPGNENHDWAQQQFGGSLGGALIKDKLFWFVDGERNRRDLQNPVLAGFPFSGRSTTINEPFREIETTDRLDYAFSNATRLFYRFSYDQNSDIRSPYFGPSMQPFLSRSNTPAHAVGIDFTSGKWIHSVHFSYLRFRNVITDRSFEVGGLSNPLTDVTINIGGGATRQCESGSLFCSGPSSFAPQQNFQSDAQFRYDGSRNWRSVHRLQYGVSFNRISVAQFAALNSLAPTLSDNSTVPVPAGLTSTGDPTDPLNYPVEWAYLGNGQGFLSEQSGFGLPGGGLKDNRLDLYLADSWKVKPSLTVTYGVNWVRDTGRSDSDLPAVSQLDAWGAGYGRRIRQPGANFAPRLGVAWDPYNSGRTVIRGGIGLYYNNNLFQNVLLDRSLRLQSGSFLSTPAACVGGAPGQVVWPSSTIPVIAGTVINANGTVSPTWCGQSIGAAEPQATALQSAYQAAALAATSNANFIGNSNASASPNLNGLSLLSPDYQTPRSLQMNAGIQHELRPGLVFSADYLRNVTTRNLLGVDINHGGAANTFNLVNAINDRDNAQLAHGCSAGTNQVGCMIAALGSSAAALAAYGAAGIGGPAQVTGGAPCPTCAFPGLHPNAGVAVMNFPYGRSVYYGLDLSLKQQIVNFAPGIKHAYLQVSYSRSKYVDQSDDSGLATLASDYSNPTFFTGPSAFDRYNQFAVGGYFDVPHSFRVGLLGHFASPLPVTLHYQQNAGAAEVLVTDWTGDGSTGDIVEGSNIGSYMRGIKPSGLASFITNYNTNVAGALTPAGAALVTAGVFCGPTNATCTVNELQELGATLQPLALPVQNPVGLSWLKTFDVRLSWEHTFFDRVAVEPSVSVFNLFNMANFDLPGNTQSGLLNFGLGSISQPATAVQPQGTVGGVTSDANNMVTSRINRAGSGSGTVATGAPRSIEWGLKISF